MSKREIESVTEYTVTMLDESKLDDFISEDKDEADAFFAKNKKNVKQYFEKTWIKVNEEWQEDYVEVYYNEWDNRDDDNN